MTEEPDPEAISPTNHNPMPASGPVLTGPHAMNSDTPEGMTSSPAAFQSASRVPSASKSSSKLPAASRSTNSTKPSTSNKGARKPSTTGANQPAASEQQPQKRLPDIVQASREELFNLKAVIQSGTRDNDTQTSSSTTEEDETESNAVNHGDTSEFNTSSGTSMLSRICPYGQSLSLCRLIVCLECSTTRPMKTYWYRWELLTDYSQDRQNMNAIG